MYIIFLIAKPDEAFSVILLLAFIAREILGQEIYKETTASKALGIRKRKSNNPTMFKYAFQFISLICEAGFYNSDLFLSLYEIIERGFI